MKLEIIDNRRPDDLKIPSSKLERGDIFEYNGEIWIVARGFESTLDNPPSAVCLKGGILAMMTGREKVLPVNAKLIISGFVARREEE